MIRIAPPRLAALASVAALVFLALASPSAPAFASPKSQDCPSAAPKGDYVLDKRHTSLIAKVPHLGGFSRFTMRFDKVDGAFSFDPATWADTKLMVTIDPTSVSTALHDTAESGFDKTIANSYLEAAKYPVITFVVTKVEGASGHGTITGDLTLHGVTKPVTLDVTYNGFGPGLLGAGTRMGFTGTAHIKRSDYGVNAVTQFAGDDVDLLFEVEFVRKAG